MQISGLVRSNRRSKHGSKISVWAEYGACVIQVWILLSCLSTGSAPCATHPVSYQYRATLASSRQLMEHPWEVSWCGCGSFPSENVTVTLSGFELQPGVAFLLAGMAPGPGTSMFISSLDVNVYFLLNCSFGNNSCYEETKKIQVSSCSVSRDGYMCSHEIKRKSNTKLFMSSKICRKKNDRLLRRRSVEHWMLQWHFARPLAVQYLHTSLLHPEENSLSTAAPSSVTLWQLYWINSHAFRRRLVCANTRIQ